MELDNVLRERRSIRKYSNKEVSWLLVSEVLEAGQLAPSAGNLQNWYFIVIRKKYVRERVLKYCDGCEWAIKAPILIVVCADIEKAKRMFGPKGVEVYSVQNCACAAMQMMLKAQDIGLGTCWIGSFDEKAVSNELNIEKTTKPLCILTLGYGETQEKLTRNEISNMVFFDMFGEKERKRDYSMLPLSVPAKRTIDPMKEKLKTIFEDSSDHHRAKVKKFIDKFNFKKK